MPYFGKWIDAGETAMPHFSVAQKSDLATTSEYNFRGHLIANSSRQSRMSTGSQHNDQLSLTRTSSNDSCEKVQEGFVTFPTDDAFCMETKGCKARQKRIDLQNGAKKKN